jgi:penicillin-binding protein-related factor A (putative recombinase)
MTLALPLFPDLPAPPAPAAHRGLAFERLVEGQVGGYRAQGWLCLRQYAPSVVVGDGSMAKVIGRAAPDWLLTRHGVVVVAELKSTETLRWSLADLADHQASWLDNAAGAGASAGVLLQLGDGAVWWLPWYELRPVWVRWRRGEAARGEASLDDAALLRLGERADGDWLAVAVR